MEPRDLQSFATSAETMLDVSGALIREIGRQPFDTMIKSDGSPVTDVDREVEEGMREFILKHHSDHGIMGEEYGNTNAERELVWTIDPIDGTLPFLAGFPVFGTLLSLMQNGKPILGVIDMPMTRERWIGRQGEATLRNGEAVHTRTCSRLGDAVMSTSNPDFYSKQDRPYLDHLRQETKLNVYGGSCMAYAQIATGRIDIGFDVGFDIHDYLALVPVIEGAGGIITDWQGNALTKTSGDKLVACGDGRVHEQAIKVFQTSASDL